MVPLNTVIIGLGGEKMGMKLVGTLVCNRKPDPEVEIVKIFNFDYVMIILDGRLEAVNVDQLKNVRRIPDGIMVPNYCV